MADGGKEGKEGATDGGDRPDRKTPLSLQLPDENALEGGKLLPIGTLTELPDAVRPVLAGGGITRCILAFLPTSFGVESLRVVCRGGWMLIERSLQTILVDGLLGRQACLGDHTKGASREDVQTWLRGSPLGAPATAAEALALCRGKQQKAAMVMMVEELEVANGMDLAPEVAWHVRIASSLHQGFPWWEGVTMESDAQVVKIDFSGRCGGGDIAKLRLPVGLKELNLNSCFRVTGDLTQLILPIRMQSLGLSQTKVTGDLAKLNLPACMQNLDLGWCGKLTGDVNALVLPEGMQNLNFQRCMGLTGDVAKLVLCEGMQSVNFYYCTGLTGDVTKLVLPDGIQNVNFQYCTGLTGDVSKLVIREGMQSVNFDCCRNLTGDLGQLVLPEGMQSVNFQYCDGVTGKLPPSERAMVKNYSGP